MTARSLTIFAAFALACAAPSSAQQRFDSAEAAADAVISAAEAHDSARLSAILGQGARAILTSGDSAQDRAEQTEFAHLAHVQHRLEIPALNPNRAVLAIGDEDWPFPIPIVRVNGKWSFDASDAQPRCRRGGSAPTSWMPSRSVTATWKRSKSTPPRIATRTACWSTPPVS